MASAAATDLSGFSIVPTERLRALEALEAELPAIIQKAKEDFKKEQIDALRMRDKENPKAHVARTAQWKREHRDEYNAKRREQYKRKRDAEKSATAGGAGSPEGRGAVSTPE